MAAQPSLTPDPGPAPARRRLRGRVPTILQLDAVECGAASLAMVLAYHGRWEPLIDLRRLCGVSRDGVKASSIVRAARRFGLEATGYRYDPAELRALPLPAIAFVNMNHFVVLERISRGRVLVVDPAVGRIAYPRGEFEGIYSGVVLTFSPGEAFASAGRKPGILRPVAGLLRDKRGVAALVGAAGLVMALTEIIPPSFSRVFVDDIVTDAQNEWLPWLIAAMVATAIVQLGLTALQARFGIVLRNQTALSAAAGYVWRILRLPVAFFAQRSPGNVSSRVDMADRLGDHAASQLIGLLVAATAMFVIAVVMLAYSPVLAAIVVGIAAAGTLVLLGVRQGLVNAARKLALDGVKLGGQTMHGLATIESIKASGTENAFFERWAGQHALVANQQQRVGRIEIAFAAMPTFLTQLGALAVLGVAGLLVMQGSLTLGMLVAFIVLQSEFFGLLSAFAGHAMQLGKARGTLDQFEDVSGHALDSEFEAAAPEVAGADAARGQATPPRGLGQVRKLEGHVELCDLTFGYSPLEAPLLRGFCLTLRPGSSIALVGRSGSGKSTVGRLVSGLLPPWSGDILLDGRPLRAWPRAVVRNSMAVVDQDITMFSGSVRDNIALWDPTMPEDRIVRAAKDAMIHDDIAARPGAYDSRVDEDGRNFSGGQRQRLEIARALVNEPSVLVLDEATSALDPIVEQAVMRNLRRRGCTCIIIAHRLSTIRDCDEIIVMEGGAVLQRGTHDALAARDGAYRTLIET